MKKFKVKDKTAAQLAQAFKRHEQAIIQLTAELVKNLSDIAERSRKTVILQGDKIADAHADYIKALYASTLVADATARPSVDDIFAKRS
ncbi:MAG: hypothetical protein II948_03850 [Synergistaceae bacterium]|nr:hypothetical protein [Synergistaceae bacterium]MBQ4418883.1 hypothetical protein [Synergistaceae bacterium]MBQ6909482.1 hypothetical protein [Synergistaceae bacterium]MBR0221362.1 hypothetical protein [Synergistaceae bacterium]